jgi:hypothetical protein
MIKAWPKWCFSLCIHNMPWLDNYNFRIGWRTQTKIFPWNSQSFLHFTTNLITTYKTLLILSKDI